MIRGTLHLNSVSNGDQPGDQKVRTGGWSESVYFAGSAEEARAAFLILAPLRAQLLPGRFFIDGLTLQVVDGGSSTQGLALPGPTEYASDAPQMALQIKMAGMGVVNSRTFALRGIPDAMIKSGEYHPESYFHGAVLSYIGWLAGGDFRFKGRKLSNDLFDIVDISVAGVLQMVQDESNVDAGDLVQLYHAKDQFGNSVKGTFTAAKIGAEETLTLIDWAGQHVVKGKFRIQEHDYFGMKEVGAKIGPAVVRKVGRPFGGYRGRASNRTS